MVGGEGFFMLISSIILGAKLHGAKKSPLIHAHTVWYRPAKFGR